MDIFDLPDLGNYLDLAPQVHRRGNWLVVNLIKGLILNICVDLLVQFLGVL